MGTTIGKVEVPTMGEEFRNDSEHTMDIIDVTVAQQFNQLVTT